MLLGVFLFTFIYLRGGLHVGPRITAAQILELQSDEAQQDRLVIIDVRSKAETDVSMIPGALTKSEFEETIDLHQGKTIVVYCTVGARSGRYAAKLNRKGWHAMNYKGSIMDWCKNKLPLETRDGRATNQVHTYSARYAAPQSYIPVR